MLGLVKAETNDKRKPSQDLQRNKDESIPRQDPRMEGGETDLPMDPPVTVAAQAGHPFRGVGVNGLDPNGGEDVEDGPKKAREIVADGPNSATKEADSARQRSSTVSLHSRRHSFFRPPPSPHSSPKPARYAYEAWTIRCKVTTTYLIEKAPAGQPELEKIAQKHQSASNLSSLVALPPEARKAVNEFLDRPKSSEASLVLMEPLKKWWNPFPRRRQERPMALLVLRLREDGLGDGGPVNIHDVPQSVREWDHLSVRSPPRTRRMLVPPSPSSPSTEEISSTPEPPLPSQEEAEDLMAQYLTSFTAGPAEDGTQAREDEQMASKEGINGTDNVVGIGGQ